MNGHKLPAKELANFLRDIANKIETGDSFEGQIAYSCLAGEVKPGEFLLQASCRVGNSEGQGGCLVIGEPLNEPEQARNTLVAPFNGWAVYSQQNSQNVWRITAFVNAEVPSADALRDVLKSALGLTRGARVFEFRRGDQVDWTLEP